MKTLLAKRKTLAIYPPLVMPSSSFASDLEDLLVKHRLHNSEITYYGLACYLERCLKNLSQTIDGQQGTRIERINKDVIKTGRMSCKDS